MNIEPRKIWIAASTAMLIFSTGCAQSDWWWPSNGEGRKALEEMHALSGSWIGTGTMYSEATQETLPWTSVVSYEGVYDDLFVQQREIIELGDLSPIATLGFFGWDWEAGNPIYLSVRNDSNGAKKEAMSRAGENRYKLTRRTVNSQGQDIVDEVLTELLGDTYTVTHSRSVDGARQATLFEGEYRRATEAHEVDLPSVAGQASIPEATKRISRMNGFYRMVGEFQGVSLDGDEAIAMTLGGHAMFINFQFKEEAGGGYHGASLTSWSAEKKRFTGFMLSNDGKADPFEARLTEDGSRLVYEPLDKNGDALPSERWFVDLNQDDDHCLERAVVDGSNGSRYGLSLEFTKALRFDPPLNLEVQRKYSMKSGGFEIGRMESVRRADTAGPSVRIKDVVSSLVGFEAAFDSKADEVFWFDADGVIEYTGKFTDVKSGEVSSVDFHVESGVAHYRSQSPAESRPFNQKFVKGKDYHWTTIYVDPTDRELEKGKSYKRRVLDVSFARTKKLKESFLRMEKFTLGEHEFDCHVLHMDYGHVSGEIWIARDELGWFLVYEDAVATEGPFELVLDGYSRRVVQSKD